ncbi:Cu-Zn family superoxide dismutase [Nocardiopsis sp. Huas11]|uniref:superoxide dismutase family protein n=1 Tax=Nocardiopsis sp. Huas11 TaxID=2183912 RepID=UPI000EAF87CC|nr:superoxide dismutase family protein [Nocardiopsis sp. Huas11]RKS06217.1 Cu-Zn family superoxide dismutase [Nocardiopsis sp. Huas11]
MRTTTLTVGLALTTILATGCSQADSTDEDVKAPSEQSVQPTTSPAVTASIFMEWDEGAGAVTYDETAVPVGATADVQVRVEAEETGVQFTGTGLEGDRDFGAHVHTQPCGEDPSDAGPHYQDEPDPAATEDEPSADPAYANPENEVWLDFTTDADGNAVATATVDWTFREGEARSLVLHDHHTSTEHGEAGTAGDRLACVTVEF